VEEEEAPEEQVLADKDAEHLAVVVAGKEAEAEDNLWFGYESNCIATILVPCVALFNVLFVTEQNGKEIGKLPVC
jgi:hypothetical protein